MNARHFILPVCLLLLAADNPRDELRQMQGTWKVVSAEKDGMPVPEQELKNRTVLIQSNRYAVRDGDKLIDQGAFNYDATKSPKTIDILPSFGMHAGKKLLGIYQLDGDDRVICFAPPGEPRPTEFTTKPNTGVIAVTYKRVKK